MAARHILVVEDRDSLRRMLRAALTQEGYEVTTRAQQENARNNNRRARPAKRQAARPRRRNRPAARASSVKPRYSSLADHVFSD